MAWAKRILHAGRFVDGWPGTTKVRIDTFNKLSLGFLKAQLELCARQLRQNLSMPAGQIRFVKELASKRRMKSGETFAI
jgi:hypothetical protein